MRARHFLLDADAVGIRHRPLETRFRLFTVTQLQRVSTASLWRLM